jgi:S-adenosylmethionine hydrolase
MHLTLPAQRPKEEAMRRSRRPPRSGRPLPIVLLTDFGPQSSYVGQVKLVLARLAPRAPVLDLAHDLPPQDTRAAALVLNGARAYLPEPAIVCAVVDPGVGSARRILAARFSGRVTVLAPDDGLLPALRSFGAPTAVRVVTNRALFLPRVSPVFHGRDIFAPVAARLAEGLSLARLGPIVRPATLVPAPFRAPELRAGRWRGVEIAHVDRFGNLITNLGVRNLAGARIVAAYCAGRRFPFADHYAAVGRGRPLCLIGSFGQLELALREKSAAAALRAGVGRAVRVELSGD